MLMLETTAQKFNWWEPEVKITPVYNCLVLK